MSRQSVGDSPAASIALLACVAILAVKVWLLQRIDVNWDEFYFLSHVYSLLRGDLGQSFQTAYTHLFTWLTLVGGGEVVQIVVGRAVMLVMLAITLALIWRLALTWVSPPAAWAAPLGYLAASPVLRHGASFRADSMLAPLTIAVLLLFTCRPSSARAIDSSDTEDGPFSNGRVTLLAAAICFGAALGLTAKAVLLSPLLVTLAFVDRDSIGHIRNTPVRAVLFRLLAFAVAAAATALLILLAHRFSLAAVPVESSSQFVERAGRKALLDVPLFPRADYFVASATTDLVTWLLIFTGLVAALLRGRYAVASLGLSLLPLVFYRNAFPYYYLVMLAPACTLAAFGAESAATFVCSAADGAAGRRLLVVLVLALCGQASVNLFALRDDDQSRQRRVIAAVHAIFPQPVEYIDHSGMISSFPKANLFMSTWGLEEYKAQGRGFMRNALRRMQPPLLLINRDVLDSHSAAFQLWLLPEDRRLIEQFYLPYWGPICIAGAHATLTPHVPVTVEFPFAGRYRLVAKQPLLLDGIERRNGDVVEVGGSDRVTARTTVPDASPVDISFYWAKAAKAPNYAPPSMDLYVGL